MANPLEITKIARSENLRLFLSFVDLACQSRPFDPEDAQPADVEAGWEERRIGGLGWHLVKRAVDDLSYATDADGSNRLVLVKHLGAAAA
jgi:hypothetical protein